MKNTRAFLVIFALIVFLVGLNLRPMLAIIGPLFPALQQQAGLSATTFSLLTTLPVAMMGLAALAGPWLMTRTGAVRGIAAGLLCLTLACLWRGYTLSALPLILSALAGGAGIGVIQALMPALIRQRHNQTAATLMALFSTAIMAGAALMAASAEPLFSLIGLQPVLAVAAGLGAITLIIWLSGFSHRPVNLTTAAAVALPTSRTLLLLLFFGMGTGAYTLVLAWLPPFYIEAGWSARNSGFLLAGLTLTEVVAGLVISAIQPRFPDRRGLLLVVLALLLAGLLCLVIFQGAMPVVSTLLLGTGIGALFPLSLIVTLDHAQSVCKAGVLLSRVQGGGYLIAAVMPLVAGWVRDSGASLTHAWLMMSIGVVALMGIAWRFRALTGSA